MRSMGEQVARARKEALQPTAFGQTERWPIALDQTDLGLTWV